MFTSLCNKAMVKIVTYKKLGVDGVAINFSHEEAQRIFEVAGHASEVSTGVLTALGLFGVTCPPVAIGILTGAGIVIATAKMFDAMNHNGFAINKLGNGLITIFLNTEKM